MTDISKKQQIVMDVRVHAVTMEDALEWAKEAVLEGKPRMIATANAEMIMIAQKDPELKEILNTCDLVVPDGAGVLWAGEKLGTPFPERVAGADLAEELLKIASGKEWPVYFLGGAPGIAQRAAARFMELHVPFKLAGCHEGYFDSEEEKKIIKDIKKSGAKLLLAGLGVPKQEKWLYKHQAELGVPVAIGVGGTLDVMAGVMKRAPRWMQKAKLEWLFRGMLQPKRAGRLLALPKFVLEVHHSRK